MTVDGGVSGDDQHIAGEAGGARGCGARLDDAENWLSDGFLDGVEGQRTGGVAGDDEEVSVLLFNQEPRALSGVAGDGATGLGAVGQAGGVANEGKLCPR